MTPTHIRVEMRHGHLQGGWNETLKRLPCGDTEREASAAQPLPPCCTLQHNATLQDSAYPSYDRHLGTTICSLFISDTERLTSVALSPRQPRPTLHTAPWLVAGKQCLTTRHSQITPTWMSSPSRPPSNGSFCFPSKRSHSFPNAHSAESKDQRLTYRIC